MQWNRLLDVVVKIPVYNIIKITIDHAIYLELFYNISISYINV